MNLAPWAGGRYPELKMRWQSSRRSTNVQDRRGAPGMKMVGGGIGAVIVTILALALGINPADLMQTEAPPAASGELANDEASQFVSAVLGDTEDTWTTIFSQSGNDYPEPQLVLFTEAVQSACGFAQSAMGPFYCPSDRTIYIDLAFFDDLSRRHGAPGDFAKAYVIAHEVGHHVQNVLGLMNSSGMSRATGPNSAAVKLELQADCFAGLWAHHADRTRNLVEPGDIDEALGAASAVGDDRLQRQAQGHVVPESFTHGTSAQRAEAFRTGFTSGNVQQCNTRG